MPSAKLNDRLWRVLEFQPELYTSVMHYFQRYRTLPKRVGARLIAELKAWPLYGAVTAEMLRTAEGRLAPKQAAEVSAFVKVKWRMSTFPADLIAALGRWALRWNLLEYHRVNDAVRNVKEWWGRAELVAALQDDYIGRPSFEALLNAKLADKVSDVAVAAAVHVATSSATVTVPPVAVHPLAARVLEVFGLVPSLPNRVCGVAVSMNRLVGRALSNIDWQAVFGTNYPQAERQALWCRAYAATDITAWVNAMDVFNDWLLKAIYAHDTTLGTYNFGSIGSVLSSTRLKTNYPAIHAMVESVHEARGQSALSHAWVKKGKRLTRPTGPIKYRYLRTARKLMTNAFSELAAKW
jgi:hypothetical protein